jgi:hypothetical protein
MLSSPAMPRSIRRRIVPQFVVKIRGPRVSEALGTLAAEMWGRMVAIAPFQSDGALFGPRVRDEPTWRLDDQASA